jgi:energy-coupling factor transporter ATP-binding protein EcfA2
LEGGKYDAYNELIGTLYDVDERAKLEWAIGAIVSGDAKDIQKFIVLYGEAGAGKSTILNIIQKLFEGYYTTFEAKALTSSSNAFATEVFKSNPLVAIQHDGDLSKIEDNTKLNSIVSHEEMTMNEKYKPSYMARVNCFLFMATNRPVKITDAKSGIIRRLIDVKPSGRKLPAKRYQALMAQIDFELGAIATHCLEVYRNMGKSYYSGYRPLDMIMQTDVFFNFVESNYYTFKEQDGISLSQAYQMYKTYCDEALVEYKIPRHKFREELKNYFAKFSDIARVDGNQLRSYYSGFLAEKFTLAQEPKKEEHPGSLVLDCTDSLFDEICADCPAQYTETTNTGVVKPVKAWGYVKTKLSDINTKELHYVKVPENHIVIDFDLKDENGEKSLEKNIEAASKWPATYSEFSKSGAGIHLHYIYDGDPKRLSRVYSDGIEVKVFTGNSSLRRKLTKCNTIPIATINSGLPLKGETMINFDTVKSEKGLRELIKKNLNKEIHESTKPSIDFIYKILEDAYKSGLKYDITDMRPAILAFANNSSHQAEYCIKLVTQMKFKSEESSFEWMPLKEIMEYRNESLVFFDVEVFPNLFIIVWKAEGEGKIPVKMINPGPSEIEALLNFKLVGFNCRRYDNHILYARYIGYNNEQLFKLSQRIIDGSSNAMFGEAYNISYTDVYDFASAANKKSLKKFEIELGIHHQELGLPWDKEVDPELWNTVADYCVNDVIATEEVFHHLSGDWTARQILAELSGLSVNDTTNQHSTRIIFGDNKHPQDQFVYTDLSEMFPGYKFENGKSTYKGMETGEGGEVYAEPGMYVDVALLDVESMHPTSTEQLNLFGPYTKRFSELKRGRLLIKHKDYKELGNILDGKLTPFIGRIESGEITPKSLSNALKTVINSVYGLTSAKFDNPFRDPRNIDNIVAKRGALFMVDLKYAVEEKGFKVAHIKTDSIKIPNATKEIVDFVMDFGKKYGYIFEHEATYSKMCLVNDAVYIAQYASVDICKSLYGYVPKECEEHPGQWTATGAQFAQPYVYKTLFSKEPIEFTDLCETKSVSTSLYLDMNEGLPDVSRYEKELETFRKLNPGADIPTPHLLDEIGKGHKYHFVGKVGSFCPMKPGTGGGLLLREKDGKYYSATGSKGYRWMEAEIVKELGKQNDIDQNYYRTLVDEAVSTISKYGDFEWFVTEDDRPPWESDCPKGCDCLDCIEWVRNNPGHNSCKKGFNCIPF